MAGVDLEQGVPCAPDERVVTAVRDERVVAAAPDQTVGPRFGHQQVATRAADQGIVRPGADKLHRTCLGAGIDQVVRAGDDGDPARADHDRRTRLLDDPQLGALGAHPAVAVGRRRRRDQQPKRARNRERIARARGHPDADPLLGERPGHRVRGERIWLGHPGRDGDRPRGEIHGACDLDQRRHAIHDDRFVGRGGVDAVRHRNVDIVAPPDGSPGGKCTYWCVVE